MFMKMKQKLVKIILTRKCRFCEAKTASMWMMKFILWRKNKADFVRLVDFI